MIKSQETDRIVVHVYSAGSTTKGLGVEHRNIFEVGDHIDCKPCFYWFLKEGDYFVLAEDWPVCKVFYQKMDGGYKVVSGKAMFEDLKSRNISQCEKAMKELSNEQ